MRGFSYLTSQFVIDYFMHLLNLQGQFKDLELFSSSRTTTGISPREKSCLYFAPQKSPLTAINLSSAFPPHYTEVDGGNAALTLIAFHLP